MTTLIVLSRLDSRWAIIITRMTITVSSSLYKPLKNHEQGTHVHSLQKKIVRAILFDFLLKLWNYVPEPPI